MKEVIKFLLFIIYATIIFFIPNNIIILLIVMINILVIILSKNTNIKKIIMNLLKFMPFVLFTVIINCILDNYINAIWIGIKLLLVCNITCMYSRTTTISKIGKTIKILCTPLEILKINTEEIEVMVCISLSMIPILKREYLELKEVCRVKEIEINLKNMQIILSKLLLSFIRRVNQIDEALIQKGYDF